jgi:ribosomal protein L11 methyltransferase
MDGDDSRTLTVVVTAPLAEAELASDALWSLGAGAVHEVVAGSDVELRAALGEDRELLGRALAGLSWSWRFEEVDVSTAQTWRTFAEIVEVDPHLRIVPAWIDAPPWSGNHTVLIEPGPTFGLGNHPTTRLSLELLHRLVRPGDCVLDVGTGSGVLAITAVMTGAARATGTDVHPACLEVVTANAARNGVLDRVEVTLADLDGLIEPYDIVVANILAPVLRQLGPQLARLTRRRLILSGLLAARADEVVGAMAPLVVMERIESGDWAALVLGRAGVEPATP